MAVETAALVAGFVLVVKFNSSMLVYTETVAIIISP